MTKAEKLIVKMYFESDQKIKELEADSILNNDLKNLDSLKGRRYVWGILRDRFKEFLKIASM